MTAVDHQLMSGLWSTTNRSHRYKDLAVVLISPRNAMHKRDLCRRVVSVCLSVCLFVTFVYCNKTSNHIFKFFSQSCSHTVLVFLYQTSWHYSDLDPQRGQDSLFWTNI